MRHIPVGAHGYVEELHLAPGGVGIEVHQPQQRDNPRLPDRVVRQIHVLDRRVDAQRIGDAERDLPIHPRGDQPQPVNNGTVKITSILYDSWTIPRRGRRGPITVQIRILRPPKLCILHRPGLAIRSPARETARFGILESRIFKTALDHPETSPDPGNWGPQFLFCSLDRETRHAWNPNELE